MSDAGMLGLRVLIRAPVGRDAALTAGALTRGGIHTAICADAAELTARIEEGAGALLIGIEALSAGAVKTLAGALAGQDPWSDLPVILLLNAHGRASAPEHAEEMLGRLGFKRNVIVLDRPLSPPTLVSVARSALAARRRQYEVRDLLDQLGTLADTLEERVAERTAFAIEQSHQLRALSGELVAAEERERRRLAHVLHDHVQQILLGARMRTELLRKSHGAPCDTDVAAEVCELLDESIAATRALTVELSPPVLREQGLAAALLWLGAQTEKQHLIEVAVQAELADDPAEGEVRDFLFRSTRELLLNAVKHARAHHVRVTMSRFEDNFLRIIVADDGVGFNPKETIRQAGASLGFGLASIRERAACLGGALSIESAPGRGTRMTLLCAA